MGAAERLTVAEIEGRVIQAIDHIQRYELAARLVEGVPAVDVGCGVGYGSAILAQSATDVIGVDVAEDAVAEARAHYAGEKTDFVADDAAAFLAANDEPGRAVVAFEAIEHIEDLEPLVQQLARRAARGDVLVLSVPNSAFIEEDNEFHVFNYSLKSAGELYDRIGEHTLLCQFLAEGAMLVPAEGGELPSQTTWFGEPDNIAASHFIGVFNASAEQIEALGSMTVSRSLTSRYMKQLERTNRELWIANGGLWKELQQVVSAAGTADSDRSAFGSAAASQVGRLRDERDFYKMKAEAMESSLSWRLTRFLRGAKRVVRGNPGS